VGEIGFETLLQMVESKQQEYRDAMRTYLMSRFPELGDAEEGDLWSQGEGESRRRRQYA
jgi:hypothetical protein